RQSNPPSQANGLPHTNPPPPLRLPLHNAEKGKRRHLRSHKRTGPRHLTHCLQILYMPVHVPKRTVLPISRGSCSRHAPPKEEMKRPNHLTTAQNRETDGLPPNSLAKLRP